uniref:hypothetical protein n=2 Tax=unclassified Haematobacter TaxID=2640585 RepID=UPI0028AB59AB
MTRAELKRQIEILLAAGDQRIRNGFIASVAEIVNDATLSLIARALDRGDIEAAIDAVGVERAAFRALEDAIGSTYSAGGVHAAKTLPSLRDSSGARVVVRFDARNERAEEWLRDHSSSLVTSVMDDQRAAIRSALTDGMMAGQNPRTTALDVVGRISGNSRSGGIVGLTSQQERTVAWVRRALQEGDADALRRYMTLTRRDKRFDRSIAKVIDGTKKLTPDDVVKITGRLSDSYLQLRGGSCRECGGNCRAAGSGHV